MLQRRTILPKQFKQSIVIALVPGLSHLANLLDGPRHDLKLKAVFRSVLDQACSLTQTPIDPGDLSLIPRIAGPVNMRPDVPSCGRNRTPPFKAGLQALSGRMTSTASLSATRSLIAFNAPFACFGSRASNASLNWQKRFVPIFSFR
jgi:hypothetical protein